MSTRVSNNWWDLWWKLLCLMVPISCASPCSQRTSPLASKWLVRPEKIIANPIRPKFSLRNHGFIWTFHILGTIWRVFNIRGIGLQWETWEVLNHPKYRVFLLGWLGSLRSNQVASLPEARGNGYPFDSCGITGGNHLTRQVGGQLQCLRKDEWWCHGPSGPSQKWSS